MKETQQKYRTKIQWLLVFYDVVIFASISAFCTMFPSAYFRQDVTDALIQVSTMAAIIFICRFIFSIYKRIWRYEGVIGYLNLILSDCLALLLFLPIYELLPIQHNFIFIVIAIGLLNLLVSIVVRLLYRYIYKYGLPGKKTRIIFGPFVKIISAGRIDFNDINAEDKINIAVVGAGRTGESFVYDLLTNPAAFYKPMMFIEKNPNKIGKIVNDIKVYPEDKNIFDVLKKLNIKEIVITAPNLSEPEKNRLFNFYKDSDCKIKLYDYPTTVNADGKRHLRNFDIEDLMPRNQIDVENEDLNNFYDGKTVLITGGGGSIGSEIARQVYKIKAKKLILLDVYENGVYDVQQEFILNKDKADTPEVCVEICNIVDNKALERVFKIHRPEIVLHAAAHKHVPLMEANVIEAIENNIFGTYNLIKLSEKYNVFKLMMVSTDKAVNPTNVMGATKRFCEMMVKSYNQTGKVRYGSTRFGNVLGSAGSVVPLFRRQIANGGPVTVTDRRIVRYFMTIPEACNLVLEASRMTNNGELFVLDMGSPVRIWDLAKNMINISGVPDIEIVEIGLRPGEKLFEEILLSDSSKHDKTDNDLIYIEKEDETLSTKQIQEILKDLKSACKTGDNAQAREALKKAVPEFKEPDEINKTASEKIENL